MNQLIANFSLIWQYTEAAAILENFVKFSEQHLRWRPFFNKSVFPSACNFIEKEISAQVFPCKFCEILQTPFL